MLHMSYYFFKFYLHLLAPLGAISRAATGYSICECAVLFLVLIYCNVETSCTPPISPVNDKATYFATCKSPEIQAS